MIGIRNSEQKAGNALERKVAECIRDLTTMFIELEEDVNVREMIDKNVRRYGVWKQSNYEEHAPAVWALKDAAEVLLPQFIEKYKIHLGNSRMQKFARSGKSSWLTGAITTAVSVLTYELSKNVMYAAGSIPATRLLCHYAFGKAAKWSNKGARNERSTFEARLTAEFLGNIRYS
jgi:hypothetical protein